MKIAMFGSAATGLPVARHTIGWMVTGIAGQEDGTTGKVAGCTKGTGDGAAVKTGMTMITMAAIAMTTTPAAGEVLDTVEEMTSTQIMQTTETQKTQRFTE